MMHYLLVFLIGMGAPAAVFWIKPRDSGWDNRSMVAYFAHCLLFIFAAYSVGFWRGAQ
jgi:hypothetical protein